MDLTDSHALRARFAETYPSRTGRHPLEYIHLYERITEHADADTPASETARRFGVEQNRVYSWIHEERTPKIATGLKWVDDRGWFDLRWDDETTQDLNTLVAWLCAVGTLTTSYQPKIVVNDATAPVLVATLDRLGLEAKDLPALPSEGAAVVHVEGGMRLGRYLAALGAPVGGHGEVRRGLPPYLGRGPRALRERFAAVHLVVRARERTKSGRVHIADSTSEHYRYALAGLFFELVDQDVRVWSESVSLDPEIYEEFDFSWTEA